MRTALLLEVEHDEAIEPASLGGSLSTIANLVANCLARGIQAGKIDKDSLGLDPGVESVAFRMSAYVSPVTLHILPRWPEQDVAALCAELADTVLDETRHDSSPEKTD